MSEQPNILLTVYGLTSLRAGLVRSVLKSRNFLDNNSDAVLINTWHGSASRTGAMELLDSLRKLGDLSFEAELTIGPDREVIVYTPELGFASASIDSFGNIILTEHRMLQLVRDANQNMLAFERFLDEALLTPWQLQFEEIRQSVMMLEHKDARTSVA
jgi:hypothetical protein